MSIKKFLRLLNSAQDYAFNGTVKLLDDSQAGTQLLFLLALIFVYLILAAQFESFHRSAGHHADGAFMYRRCTADLGNV